MTEPSTPLMRQYAAIKKEHPSALLFFRLGDFYELFFDDAVLAAKELQITLTSRNKEKGIAIPMCGVPHHAAEGYISKLIRKGFKVAICEQVEDPRLAKKLVRREVTRVVTPGTAADSSLGSEENNFLAAIAQTGERVGFAALDLSTGEFRATEFQGEDAGKRIQEEIQQLRPKEVLYASSAPLFEVASRDRAGGRVSDPSRPPNGRLRLRRNSARRLDLRPRPLHPAAGKSFWSAVAGGLRPVRQAGSRGRRRRHSLLRPLHPARNSQPRRPHRILRTSNLPGAGCGHGAQPGTDRTALRRRRCRHHAVPLDRRHGDAHGQAPVALLAAAPVDRHHGDQRPSRCRRVSGKGNHRPRGTSPRARWHSRPGTPAQPGHARNRQPARRPRPGRFSGQAAGGAQSSGALAQVWPRPTRPRTLRHRTHEPSA